MVSSDPAALVHGVRISSIGPGHISGENRSHELGAADLAMKLHYIRAVYFFPGAAAVPRLKESGFTLFDSYFVACGRFRRSDSGRPYIKCNDCGARFVEAYCDLTVEEWLRNDDAASLEPFLLPHNFIGPELPFSPPVFLQVTRFRCGGISLGLGWAHVIGDAFSASDFLNQWGRVLAGLEPNNQPLQPNKIQFCGGPLPPLKDPLSAKRIDPVGDFWAPPGGRRMTTFTLRLGVAQLARLRGHAGKTASFESLCALIWRCVARFREEHEPRRVTLCRKDPARRVGDLSNGQGIYTADVDFAVAEAALEDLAAVLTGGTADDRGSIAAAVEGDGGVSDFVVYGANLTFVDLEGASLYEMEMQGQKPLFVNYTVEGVGDEGVIFVHLEPEAARGGGRVVTATLPESEAAKVKSELTRELGSDVV